MKRISAAIVAILFSAVLAEAGVYVSTDKPCYVAGEQIRCSAFSSDANSVAYLELRSTDGLVQTGKIVLDKGRGAGSLTIPFTVPTGNYVLVGYTAAARAVPSYDFYSGATLVSIFNTFQGERVKDGVEVVDEDEYRAAARVPGTLSAGLDVAVSDSLELRNISGENATLCMSVSRADGISQPRSRYISSFASGEPGELVEFDGEIISARLVGTDAPEVSKQLMTTAFISIPGDKTASYTSTISPDLTMSFRTDPIYGDRDIVCEVEGAKVDDDCHMEIVSPFIAPAATDLPKLLLTKSLEGDLVRRSAAMQASRASIVDTIPESLPVRRDHIFLDRECKEYVLDDYVRFPTMKELFVEIIKEMRVRKTKGVSRISVLLEDNVQSGAPSWGTSLVMIDGVPIFNHEVFLEYDPALVRLVEIYPYSYSLGGRVFGGVANFVTYKGNMPLTNFVDNVRIYDYKGFSYPTSDTDSETVCWHPLVDLPSAGRISVPLAGAVKGESYDIVVEGLTESGRPVYFVRRVKF